MNYTYVLLSILIMALVTYLPRMPLVLFRKTIENQFIKSFLAYVPYAVLGAMTFPSILFSTSPDGGFSLVYFLGGLVGMLAAMVLAYFNRVIVGGCQFGCCSIYNTRVIGFYYVKIIAATSITAAIFFCSCLHRAVGI